MDGKIVFWLVFLPITWLNCSLVAAQSVVPTDSGKPKKPDGRFLRWDKN